MYSKQLRNGIWRLKKGCWQKALPFEKDQEGFIVAHQREAGTFGICIQYVHSTKLYTSMAQMVAYVAFK